MDDTSVVFLACLGLIASNWQRQSPNPKRRVQSGLFTFILKMWQAAGGGCMEVGVIHKEESRETLQMR